MEWLTSASAPWWATIVSSLATFVLGNVLSNRSTEKQREADMVERKAERDHSAQQQERDRVQTAAEREHERTAAAAAAEAEAEQQRTAAHEMRLYSLATEAIDSISNLRAIFASAQTYDDLTLDPTMLAAFIQRMSRLQLILGDDQFSPAHVVNTVRESVAKWNLTSADSQRAEYATHVITELEMTADRIVNGGYVFAPSSL